MPTKQWVTFDDKLWERDLKTGTTSRLVRWRLAGTPTFFVVKAEGGAEDTNYGSDYEPVTYGARCFLNGEDYLDRTGAARAMLEGMSIELERQRRLCNISEKDFKLVCDSEEVFNFRPDGRRHLASEDAKKQPLLTLVEPDHA